MRSFSKIGNLLVFVFLFFGNSFADYFLDMNMGETNAAESRALPIFAVGAGASLDYYFNSFNGGAQITGQFRFHRHHAVDLFGAIPFDGDFYEVGLDYRFYFTGKLMSESYDDFLRLGVSGIYMEKNDDSYFPPAVSLGYGRDFLFFKKADFMGRVEVRASYILGEPLSQKMKDLPMTEDTHFIAYLQFSLLFF